MTNMETIGYWLLTAFLIWLPVRFWMPGKIADALGKLLSAVFVIWVVVSVAYGSFTTYVGLVLLVMAAVAFWLGWGFRKKT
jgi:hypothetical protein